MFNNLCIKAKIAAENFIQDQKGVTAIEYAIIGVAVSALVLAVFVTDTAGLKAALTGAISKMAANITSANTVP
ncbi:Flp family type IVb pilin [Vibrio panuliri]|uniref:Fimbrial protein n=1 Tax=Vibrio panuliri TaxID=1381081 RepID=A0A1Q9HAZ6_9VIBR|nr:Flp family type IVb pilin [Vibrio panuliri]KAB1457553.1 Flp family type IVb pilin [Vibrio panuliri]OLQ86345.1 fimbrial protein [Vibrio panuliri]OLQ91246.1 fimbrial protein [Vibrio panuliri]